MATVAQPPAGPSGDAPPYSVPAADVAARLGVDPAAGLTAARAGELLAGHDEPTERRISYARSLQIDESALTVESTPAAKEVRVLDGTGLGPGDQINMAFMHTPVTHGSGVVVVTATGADTQVGKIAGMLASTEKEKTP